MAHDVGHQFEEIKLSIGNFFDDYLEYKGYTVNRASKELGYNRDTIYRLLSKDYNSIRLYMLCDLANKIEVDVFDLLKYKSENDFKRLIEQNKKLNG